MNFFFSQSKNLKIKQSFDGFPTNKTNDFPVKHEFKNPETNDFPVKKYLQHGYKTYQPMTIHDFKKISQ